MFEGVYFSFDGGSFFFGVHKHNKIHNILFSVITGGIKYDACCLWDLFVFVEVTQENVMYAEITMLLQ